MPVTSYNSFIQYFSNLAASHEDVVDFVHGNDERILNRMRSAVNYPILWLEVADVTVVDDDTIRARLDSSFLVLHNAEKDDPAAEDQLLSDLLLIVFHILQKMQEDSDSGEFEFESRNASIQHKGRWGTDNDWGWRVDFSIIIGIDCSYTDKFS
jgi:hypothetical protein